MNALLLTLILTADPTEFSGTAMKVVDAGTIRIQPEGERKWRTIKLIGVDAPVKSTRDVEGQEPWGARAQQFLSLIVTRKKVRVEYDVLRFADMEETESYGYVWLDDRLLNEEVLKAGHALLAVKNENVKYHDRLALALKEVQREKRGIWDPTDLLPESPEAFKAKVIVEPPPPETALTKWQEGCVIGNRKSKVFHVTGGRYYDGMKLSKDAIFFPTAEIAEKAGYKKSLR